MPELLTLKQAEQKLQELKKGGATVIPIDDVISSNAQAQAEAQRSAVVPGADKLGGIDEKTFKPDASAGLAVESHLRNMAKTNKELFQKFTASYKQSKAAGASGVNDVARSIFPSLIGKDATTTGATTGTGLVPYSLESPALYLFPVYSPILNRTPRRTVGGQTVRWKIIKAIQRQHFGFVPEATSTASGRAPFMNFVEQDKGGVAFAKIGLEDFLTTEAQYAAKSTIDGADFQTEDLIRIGLVGGMKLLEEDTLLGANTTILAAPTGAVAAGTQPAAGTGSLTANTDYYMKISALTYSGYRFYGSNGNNGSVDSNGETTPSSELHVKTAVSGAGADSIKFSWTAVPGAVAYGIYAYTSTGGERFVGYSTTNVYTLTALGTSTNTPNTANLTVDADANGYSGLIEQFTKNGGYSASLGGAGLTSDGTTNVTEFDTAFKYFYDTYRVSPDVIWVASDQKRSVDKIVLGSNAPIYRIELKAGEGDITAGAAVAGVYNRYFNKVVEVITHPTLPAGTILFQCFNLGQYYPYARLAQPLEILCGFDYLAIDWPQIAGRREFGLYSYNQPLLRALFCMGALQNVA